MKKTSAKYSVKESDDMRAEYNFRAMKGGVRGKYYKAYREGHTVKIDKADGTSVIQHFKLEDGAVVLAPDVQKYFPDSDSVNEALRCLIPLVTKRGKAKTRA